jgi:alpha-glucosidase (family GH31 glycosyl hydrolase)
VAGKVSQARITIDDRHVQGGIVRTLRWSALLLLLYLCLPTAQAQTNFSWSGGAFRLDVGARTITIYHGGRKLLAVNSINFNFARPIRIEMGSAMADKLILLCHYPREANNGSEPNDHTAMIEVTVKGNALRFTGNPAWAANATIQLQDGGEHYFGILERLFPNNRKSPDLRGEVVDVEVLGNGSQYRENWASAWSAFYMTNKGYASFYDTFAAGRYKLGINEKTELYHQTGKLDWYIIAGNNGDELLKTYYEIIGRPKKVPLWACGPIGWRDENKGGKNEILDDIQRMTDLKIPFTAWWVDRPYSRGGHRWSKMDFDAPFADPAEWIATIRQKFGMEFMTWVASCTFGDKEFPGLFPGERSYMDLSNPNAVAEFGKRLKELQYSAGVRGHKLDRGDEYFPEMESWYDKTPIPERRNKYAWLFAKTIDGYLRDAYGDDQVTFARAAYQGSQRYLTAIWGGDSRASWDGLASSLANAVRCGFIGFPVWGSDVGGYLGGKIPEDLFARWLQLGAWSGLFEIKLDHDGAAGEDRPPWKYSERLQKIFRDCATLRMELQPFIYSLANTSYKNGVVMKPLAYAYPNDPKTYSNWNEFLLGRTFLVAPIVDSTNTRTVYLPEGIWYDFYNVKQTYEGGRSIVVTRPLEKMPVFISANSIYVTGALFPGNSKLWNGEKSGKKLEIVAFPGAKNSRTAFMYVDSGDGDKEKNITLEKSEKTIKVNIPALTADAKLSVQLSAEPSGASVNGNSVKAEWNSARNMAMVVLTKGIQNKIVITTR